MYSLHVAQLLKVIDAFLKRYLSGHTFRLDDFFIAAYPKHENWYNTIMESRGNGK